MLDAGSVVATLSGVFNPGAFVAFDGAMKKSAAGAAAAEKQMTASQQRSSAAMSMMGANAGKASTAARAGFLAIGAGAAIGLGKSVQAAMSFEKQMSSLQAYTKAGTQDMKLMSAAARDLGTKTGVGATQAAKGLTELAKGGLTAKQATEALVGTINLAQAGDMDLTEASNAVVQSMSTFGLKAKDATMIVDGLASAANKTTMDVSDFTQAFAQGGLAAANAGMSFDETLNVMGVMANRFKSGSDMGTSLKTTLTALARPTNKAKDEMHRLNIDLFDSHGKFRKASEVTKQLGDRFAEMTPKQRTASAAIIAGTDGMRTLIALANAPKGKGGNFREVGAGADVAATKMDNLAGSWKRLKANMENVGITVGDKVIPSLRDASDALNEFLTDMQEEKPGSAGGAFQQVLDFAKDGSGMSWDFLKRGAEATQYLLDAIGNYHPKDVTITAKVADEASPVLARLKDEKFAPKVQKILADDSSPRQKYEALRALRIPDKVARLILQEKGVDGAIAALNRIPHTVPVTARLRDEASQILNNIINRPLKDKVARIIADDDDVQSKIRRLMGLGISGPTAHFLANTVSVVDAANQLRGQRITVPVQYVPQVMRPSLPGGLPTPGDKSAGARRAAGRGPIGEEAALVGEGGGPEAVGNPRDGFRMTTGPELVGLGPDDWVIPTESRYRGRAMELMASALGIPAFKKGKKPRKKQPRPIPKSVYLGHSVEFFDSEVAHLEQVGQERNKKNKPTARARKARKELAEMKRVQKRAHSYDDRVKKHEDEANIQRDNMSAADSRDDVKGYKAAWKNRKSSLERARVLLRGALRFAPPSSKYHQDIRARIAQINTYLDDMTGDKAGSPLEAKTLDETAFTDAERGQLEGIDAQIALAALTAPTDDDLAAQQAKERFLAPLLAAVQSSGGDGRGGASAITEIAGELKSTRDAITDLTRAPDITADQQATADQAYQRGLATGTGQSIDRLVAAVTDGGGGARGVTVNYNALTASPRDAMQATETIVAGIGYQGGRPRSSTRVAA